MRTCAQAGSIRAMPETEIPRATRVDIYYLIRTARLGRTERSAVRVKAIIASKSRIKCNKNIKNYVEAYMLPAGI